MVGRFTETLGQYLRRERESRSISLEEVSRATRIGLSFLEALERDDFRFFSRPEFIPGFLKGYARHIGLDVQEVLRRYHLQSELTRRKENFHQMPLFPNTVGPEEEAEEPEVGLPRIHQPQRQKRSYRKILLQIIIVSVALGLSWYIQQLLKISEKAEKTLPAKATSSENTSKEDPSAKISSKLKENVEAGSMGGKRKVMAHQGEKTYYLPGMRDYEKMEPGHRVEFDSEKEAIKAGYRRAPQ
jgi:cytoskeletal protein RodZ